MISYTHTIKDYSIPQKAKFLTKTVYPNLESDNSVIAEFQYLPLWDSDTFKNIKERYSQNPRFNEFINLYGWLYWFNIEGDLRAFFTKYLSIPIEERTKFFTEELILIENTSTDIDYSIVKNMRNSNSRNTNLIDNIGPLLLYCASYPDFPISNLRDSKFKENLNTKIEDQIKGFQLNKEFENFEESIIVIGYYRFKEIISTFKLGQQENILQEKLKIDNDDKLETGFNGSNIIEYFLILNKESVGVEKIDVLLFCYRNFSEVNLDIVSKYDDSVQDFISRDRMLNLKKIPKAKQFGVVSMVVGFFYDSLIDLEFRNKSKYITLLKNNFKHCNDKTNSTLEQFSSKRRRNSDFIIYSELNSLKEKYLN